MDDGKKMSYKKEGRLYLSLALPGDEKAELVHHHFTVGLKDVRVLRRRKK